MWAAVIWTGPHRVVLAQPKAGSRDKTPSLTLTKAQRVQEQLEALLVMNKCMGISLLSSFIVNQQPLPHEV